MHQRQMDLLYRIILFASGALPIKRLEVAQGGHAGLGTPLDAQGNTEGHFARTVD